MKIKTTLLFLFTCVVFAACSKTKKGYVNGIEYSITPVDSTKNFVIDASEFYGVVFDKNSQRYGEETKTFTPTPEEVFKAEEIFRRCLGNKTVAAGVVMDASRLKDLSNYYRQYVGVINEQRQKEVQIHFFNKSHQFLNDWRKIVYDVSDGGNDYFGTVINISTEECTFFNVNGIALSKAAANQTYSA